MLLNFIDFIGVLVLSSATIAGDFALFLVRTVKTLFTTRLKVGQVIKQMENIGVGSFNIIFLTGTFTGAVLALQSYSGFKRFGAEEFIGPVVGLSMTRELGPVLTGLMVTGRSGSAMTAEIGTMRITEQIDALQTLRINRYQYLMVPRILASTIILPFLCLFSMFCGIMGGYVVSVYLLELNPEEYLSGMRKYGELSDITGGLIKASVFGLILSWVGTYNGYHTKGGARGVGIATTRSVVIGSILILIANYFLTALLFETGV
jgi:phospholipid/cholesterol/gamma-HCH transport system permease protein